MAPDPRRSKDPARRQAREHVLWMSELIGMVLSAVNVITAKLLRLPFRKALAEHPFGEQRTQVPAARFLHRPL